MGRKTLFLFVGLVIFFGFHLASSQEVSANEQIDDDLYDGLEDGETVVDFHREIVPQNETEVENGSSIEIENPGITTQERRKRWYTTSKKYIGLHHGPWKYAGASTISGGSLSASHTKKVANTYTGQLGVSKRGLSSYIGFNVEKSWSQVVTYKSKTYKSGRYRLQYRHVYKNYMVKQEQKYDSRGKVYGTKYVYPKKWIERQYRVVKF